MKRVHPFWSNARQAAYTEAAFYILLNGDDPYLNDVSLVDSLSPTSMEWVRELPHGFDETFRDPFIDDLFKFNVVVEDAEKRVYRLGDVGRLLVDTFLEEWTTLE